MKVKILVLGVGNAQVDLIEYLRTINDIEIHALSNSLFGMDIKGINYFGLIDIVDKKSVLSYVKKNSIDYVYSIGSDVAMPTVMWVAEEASLPHFVSSSTAVLCNSKYQLREKLKNSYGAVQFQLLSENRAVDKVSFPAIVKPVDSQGQRGVTTVYSDMDLNNAYNHALGFSRSKKVIIEDKIDGPEISVNAYVIDGELVFFLPSDRVSWKEYDGGIVHRHILPASLNDVAYDNVRNLVFETIINLNIYNGPVYFQIKMVGDLPYLIEVTPRLDGCHMWRLIQESTGINLLEISINHLFGKSVYIDQDYKVKNAVLEFICQAPGGEFVQPTLKENIRYIKYYYQGGDLVRQINGKMEKCGYFIKVIN